MAETKRLVDVYQVDFLCDACQVSVVATGMTFMTYPEQYQHQCPDCKRHYDLYKHYPLIEYRERTNEEVG